MKLNLIFTSFQKKIYMINANPDLTVAWFYDDTLVFSYYDRDYLFPNFKSFYDFFENGVYKEKGGF